MLKNKKGFVISGTIIILVIAVLLLLGVGTAFFVNMNNFLNQLGIFKWAILVVIGLIIFKNRKRIMAVFKRFLI